MPAGLPRPLAFAAQKLGELVAVAGALRGVPPALFAPLDLATWTGAPPPSRRDLAPELLARPEPYAQRRPKQVQFPPFPTTTIGSFPQTPAIRRARLLFKKGRLKWVVAQGACLWWMSAGGPAPAHSPDPGRAAPSQTYPLLPRTQRPRVPRAHGG